MGILIIVLYIANSVIFYLLTDIRELLLSAPLYLFLYSISTNEKWEYINSLFIINVLMIFIPELLIIWRICYFIILAIAIFYFIKTSP